MLEMNRFSSLAPLRSLARSASVGFVFLASAVALTGAAVADTTIYDFTGVVNPSASNLAEDGEIDQDPSVIQNATFPGRREWGVDWNSWSQASTGEYTNLVGSDDARYQGADPSFGDNAAMIFTFYVNESPLEVDAIDVSVEVGRGASTANGWVYIWNYTLGAYEIVGTQSGTADQVVSTSLTTTPADYIEAGTGELTVFVVNEDTSDWIQVDDISVAIDFTPAPSVPMSGVTGKVLIVLVAVGLGAATLHVRSQRRVEDRVA